MVGFLIKALALAMALKADAAVLTDSSINVKGVERTFHFFAPENAKNEKRPLLIFLHGGGGSGKRFFKLDNARGISLAQENGFIAVYPDGLKRRWNDGRAVEFSQSDDISFLDSLIDHFIKNFKADEKSIFIAGISNGGFMAYSYAFERPGKIRGLAAVASGLQKKLIEEKKKTAPLNTLVISGNEDPLIPFEGGKPQIHLLVKRRLGELMSWEEAKKFWLNNNSCLKKNESYELNTDKEDGTSVIFEEYSCLNSKTAFYLIKGGGHAWPGGIQYLPERRIGKTSREFNATDKIIDFFGLAQEK